MAHLRFQDLPPAMRAKVAQQLGMTHEEASGVVTTYHIFLSIGGKPHPIKTTSKAEATKILEEWRQRHPLNPCRFYVTERIAP